MPIFPPPPGAILSSWCIVATTPVADKNVWSVQRYFIAEKLKSVFTLVIEYSGELGLTRVLLNIFIAEFRETIGWSIGRKDDVCRKRKELIRHVKQDQKTRNLFNYTMRGQMSITIATRMYASYWLVARQVPSSVGFGELSLPPMLSLYKLQQT